MKHRHMGMVTQNVTVERSDIQGSCFHLTRNHDQPELTILIRCVSSTQYGNNTQFSTESSKFFLFNQTSEISNGNLHFRKTTTRTAKLERFKAWSRVVMPQNSGTTTTAMCEGANRYGVSANMPPPVVETPSLLSIVDAFEELSKILASDSEIQLGLSKFCDACSLVSILFNCLGLAFKFAELEYVSKVRDLEDASGSFGTLDRILDLDVANGTVRSHGSHSRNLRRVRQGLDLIRALFEGFLSTDDYSLREAASTAYAKVCAPYHTWAVRTAVSAGMYALPTRDQLLLKLNETDESAEKKMKRYIDASIPVIDYIDNLYIRRNITLDW